MVEVEYITQFSSAQMWLGRSFSCLLLSKWPWRKGCILSSGHVIPDDEACTLETVCLVALVVWTLEDHGDF